MEWIKRLNLAVVYIEEHLQDEIDYDQMAKIACCSTYHFQRMFSYIANVSLSEYIRRRKMTKAAVDLHDSDYKVIDVALKYGYDSPTAFNRAFQSVHGIAPSQAKLSGNSLKSFSPISFKISIKGDIEMNYRIEKKGKFRIVGVVEPIYKDIEKNFEIIPKMWQKITLEGTLDKLVSMIGGEPDGILGVSVCNEEDNWKYFIAVTTDKALEDNLQEHIVPACTWAIFPGEGAMPHAIQDLAKRIMTEWLPTSGYEYANAPEIEVYLNDSQQNSKFEIWLPVIKKSK